MEERSDSDSTTSGDEEGEPEVRLKHTLSVQERINEVLAAEAEAKHGNAKRVQLTGFTELKYGKFRWNGTGHTGVWKLPRSSESLADIFMSLCPPRVIYQLKMDYEEEHDMGQQPPTIKGFYRYYAVRIFFQAKRQKKFCSNFPLSPRLFPGGWAMNLISNFKDIGLHLKL